MRDLQAKGAFSGDGGNRTREPFPPCAQTPDEAETAAVAGLSDEYPLTADPGWTEVELCYASKKSANYKNGLALKPRHNTHASGCKECVRCVFCAAPLSSRHEHDHMPVPAMAGGRDWQPACVNCHDLKDRMPVADWPLEAYWEAFAEASPMAKILMSKLLADQLRLLAENRALLVRIRASDPSPSTPRERQ